MDHAAYQAKVRKMTEVQLRYTIRDAQEAMEANPENPNSGYYADEICYCGQELRKRAKARERKATPEVSEGLLRQVARLRDLIQKELGCTRQRANKALETAFISEICEEAIVDYALNSPDAIECGL